MRDRFEPGGTPEADVSIHESKPLNRRIIIS